MILASELHEINIKWKPCVKLSSQMPKSLSEIKHLYPLPIASYICMHKHYFETMFTTTSNSFYCNVRYMIICDMMKKRQIETGWFGNLSCRFQYQYAQFQLALVSPNNDSALCKSGTSSSSYFYIRWHSCSSFHHVISLQL